MDSCFKKGQFNLHHRLKCRYKLLVSFYLFVKILYCKVFIKEKLITTTNVYQIQLEYYFL